MKQIGFIGCGNMSQAMIAGVLNSRLVDASCIFASDVLESSRTLCKDKYGINVTDNNVEVAEKVDMLILAVKPHVYNDVIKEVKDYIKPECIVISIAAGQSITKMEKLFSSSTKIVVAMPNTPAMVSEGMSAAVINKNISEDDCKSVEQFFKSFGKLEFVSDDLLGTVSAVSGSSPAYVFMMIEAMADAAVKGGMKREQAYTFASQAVLGAAKMVLETGVHPAKLKDNVCSPKGTTIEGVIELERTGFRNSIITAMEASMDKFEKMTNQD